MHITLVVFNAREASLAAVAPMDDVERNVVELDAKVTGHVVLMAQNNRRWPL